jgi:ADP-heptose:LPS heptosyltransferase
VVRACDFDFLQFNSDSLGVETVVTSIVAAARYIAGCRCYIGTEGFLHHLAAAFGKPAVVLFGAYSHPKVTGYDFHTNIWRDVPEELGHRKKKGAMDTISPEEVIEALNDCYRGH